MKGIRKRTIMNAMWVLIFANIVLWVLSLSKIIPQDVSTGVSLVCFVAFFALFMVGKEST